MPEPEEFSKAKSWYESAFGQQECDKNKFPVSFRMDGVDSASFINGWKSVWSSSEDGDGSIRHTGTFIDPISGLELRCEVRQFKDFPAVEWVAHFKNNSDKPSALISDIQALDTMFINTKSEHSTLHYSKGSDHKIDDFEPQIFLLRAHWNPNFEIGSVSGRSSEGSKGGTLPFFNLEMGDEGVIGAVGWSGSWKAAFSREGYDNGEVSVRAGMRKTSLRLLPGEEIRTPSIVLLFWNGDYLRSQNIFRRLVLAHFTPCVNGAPAKAPACFSAWGEVRDNQHLDKIRWCRENEIDIDAYWIDAGWYGDAPFKEDSDVFNSQWGAQVGNWWPNKTTYPNGMKPIGDALHEAGLGFVLWFEPERAIKDTKLPSEFPQWMLGPINNTYFVNLGIPAAREYITDLISTAIDEGGVTCYRQDFNMPPAPFWEEADAADRIGMSEIRHIEGLYAFWDELLRRHPNLLIDNCASGGRRLDIEMTKRSIPLWRSDYQCFPGFSAAGMQNQTAGLAPWLPLNTGLCDKAGTYEFRSAFGPGIVLSSGFIDYKLPDGTAAAGWLKKMTQEQREVSKYFYGDFYPLLGYSLNEDAWALWQYDLAEAGEGAVLAFRRRESPFESLNARLKALEADAMYEIRSFDDECVTRISGGELMDKGIRIEIDEQPGTAVLIYKRIA